MAATQAEAGFPTRHSSNPATTGARRAAAGGSVRFVCVSDLHTLHRRLQLPAGEVLVVAGDIVRGRLQPRDMLAAFKDFLAWLCEVLDGGSYKQVVWIAGNHDKLLDPEHRNLDHDEYADLFVQAQKLIAVLPDDIVYLPGGADSHFTYRGLRISGQPWNVSRGGGCDAFERSDAFRQRQWAQLPEGLDLLITHNPPAEPRGVSRGRGDTLLTMRLAEMAAPPRAHVFGHDHKANGSIQTHSTLFINAEQEGSLKHWGERGRPHTFDLKARGEYTGPGLTPRRQQSVQQPSTSSSAQQAGAPAGASAVGLFDLTGSSDGAAEAALCRAKGCTFYGSEPNRGYCSVCYVLREALRQRREAEASETQHAPKRKYLRRPAKAARVQ